MTTATTIVTRAYRAGNIIAAGVTPSTAQQNEALDILNANISATLGYELGEQLSDWPVPTPQRTAPVAANYPQLPYPETQDALIIGNPLSSDPTSNVYPYPPKNSRIIFGGVAATVYFPEAPDNGTRMAIAQGSGAGDSGAVLTLNGNGRTIEGSNTKTYTDPVTAREWVYRSDLGDWKAVTTLLISDDLPFGSDIDDLWITQAAIRLCPNYSRVASAELQAAFKFALARAKTRFKQSGTTVYGSQNFPTGLQSFNSGRWFW